MSQGWGRTETERNPSELRFTKLTQVPASVCEREWSTELQKNPNPLLRSGMKILESQFCAGDVNRLSDACLGDSGGPIMVELDNRWLCWPMLFYIWLLSLSQPNLRWYLIGETSVCNPCPNLILTWSNPILSQPYLRWYLVGVTRAGSPCPNLILTLGNYILIQFNFRWYLVGVTSAGSPRCKSTPPGLYTRVSSFWQWLAENISNK